MTDTSSSNSINRSESMPTPDQPMDTLLALMARLRDPNGGCPWDIEQTFASIIPHTIEEAYEVAEAAESNDRSKLCDELGDLLLQVVFHSQMAKEEGSFTFSDVVSAISDKLIRRHPHVFGDTVVKDAAEQTVAWEAIKAQERDQDASLTHGAQKASAMDGVSTALPAITRALKLQNRAARVGFDWDDAASVIDKVEEELREVTEEVERQGSLSADTPPSAALREEIGDLLFAAVNLARKAGVDPETALRGTNRKFDWRFRTMETLADQQGKTFSKLPLDHQESLWQNAKQEEKRTGQTYYPDDSSR